MLLYLLCKDGLINTLLRTPNGMETIQCIRILECVFKIKAYRKIFHYLKFYIIIRLSTTASMLSPDL